MFPWNTGFLPETRACWPISAFSGGDQLVRPLVGHTEDRAHIGDGEVLVVTEAYTNLSMDVSTQLLGEVIGALPCHDDMFPRPVHLLDPYLH